MESSLGEIWLGNKPTDRSIINLSSAKNEYESFQIVVAPRRACAPIRGVELEFTDLLSEEARIGKEKISSYVLGHAAGGTSSKSDALFPYNSFWSIMARQNVVDAQRFWVTVYVPGGAEGGDYNGGIRVKTKNAGSGDVGIRLHVWNFRLPERMHLKTHFGMEYQELSRLYPNMPDELFREVIFRYRVNSSEHRVSCQGNVAFPLTTGRGNRIHSSYRRFDEDMNLLMNLGMNLYCIHLGDLMPHVEPKTYSLILSKMQGHLKRRRWLDVAHLHLDSNLRDVTLEGQAELARTASPGVKIVAETRDGARLGRLPKFADIWVVDANRPKHQLAKLIKLRRGEIWLDGTCKPGKHGPLCKSRRWMHCRRFFWQMWSFGVKGVVYDSALPTERAGEPLIYTWEEGLMNSVRWEIIRDGIEDYEYLSLLEETVGCPEGEDMAITSDHMGQILQKARRLLRGIRAKGGFVDLWRNRERVAAILEACRGDA